MQKNWLNSSFFLLIQQIFMFHDLKGATLTFDHAHPIIISYPEVVSRFTKSIYSIDSLMRYSQFKSPVTKVATTFFVHTHLNVFLSILNYWYQHARKQAILSLCSRDILHLKILLDQDCFEPYLRN